MEFRPLEINVISARDLKDVNHFSKMDVYAVVSINGDHRTAQRTPIDKDCGANPNWNYTTNFTIDEAAAKQNHLYLVFRLKSDRHLGDKEIGQVQVPIKELLDHNNGNGKVEQNVSYSVRLPNGKAKGVLNFSYKFGEKFEKPVPQPPVPGAEAMHVDKHKEKPAMAYPPPPPVAGYPGPSAFHPPPQGPGAYPPPPQGMAYPYPPAGGYPPPQHGYPQAPAPGYGYQGYGYPSQGGYGYPPVQQKPQKPQKPKKSGMGAGLGLGLAGGLLGGMLVGDMVGDAFEAADFGDGVDFDFGF